MNQNKQTIVFIGTTAASVYGFRADLIQYLVKLNWQVYTLICEYHESELEKIKALGAIPMTYSMSRGGLNPMADLKSMFELKKIIATIQPNIVFSYFTKPVIYGTFAAKLAKIPKIVGMIEGLGTPFTVPKTGQTTKIKLIQKAQVFLYRFAFPLLDQIIFLNPDDPIDLIENNKIRHKKDSVVVLGAIGLNLQDYAYQPWDETQPVSFIFIARLLAEKGIFDYVAAAKIVKAQYPHIKFTVIGGLDKENPNALKQHELDELVATDIIEYPGFVTNVAEYIQKSAVFVLPSYYREGVPRSTQEAMAIGRPVITTDVPGCRETVEDGVNGFLIPKWNPEALAEKMIYFIENFYQINKMGKEGHEFAEENFDVDKVNRKLCKLLGIEISEP